MALTVWCIYRQCTSFQQVRQLEDFKMATLDDLSATHQRGYVMGLERAKTGGDVLVVESSPTYMTSTSFADSARVRLHYTSGPQLKSPCFRMEGNRISINHIHYASPTSCQGLAALG